MKPPIQTVIVISMFGLSNVKIIDQQQGQQLISLRPEPLARRPKWEHRRANMLTGNVAAVNKHVHHSRVSMCQFLHDDISVKATNDPLVTDLFIRMHQWVCKVLFQSRQYMLRYRLSENLDLPVVQRDFSGLLENTFRVDADLPFAHIILHPDKTYYITSSYSSAKCCAWPAHSFFIAGV